MSKEFICKDCRKIFTLTDEDIEYFSSKKDEFGNPFALPKRCPKCRKAKRERNARKERGELD